MGGPINQAPWLKRRKGSMAGCERGEGAFMVSMEYFEGIIDCIGYIVVVKDQDYRYVLVNDAAHELFGLPRGQMIGKTDYDFFPGEQADVLRERDSRVFETGDESVGEEKITGPQGDVLTVVSKKTLYISKTGEKYVVSAGRDITGRTQMEKALRESEEKFSRAFNASPAPMCIVTLEGGRFVEVNDAFRRMVGYDRDEIIGRPLAELGMSKGAEHRKHIQRLLATEGSIRDVELRLRTKMDAERIALFSAEVVEVGGESCSLFVAMDVTDRAQAAEAMKQKNDYNRSLIETSPDPLVMVGPDNLITDLNLAAELILGLSRQEVVGTDFTDYFAEPEKAKAAHEQAFVDGEIRNCPLDLKRHDGRVASVLCDASVYWDQKGQVIGLIAVARDVTDLKQMQMRLKESEERYRTAIEHSNDGVALEKGGRHVYVNQKFLDMFGYESLNDFIQGAPHKETHPDDRERVMGYARKRQKGEPAPSRYEYKGMRKDGTVIYVEASVAATVFEGEPASLAYLRDITGRKQMEEKLKAVSTTDELTGLHNRRGFLALSQQQLRLAGRTGKAMELFFIDLDGMKQINDTLGHQEGDQALIEVSAILRQTFRKSDIIGRMGGDEFAVLAIDAADENGETLKTRLNSILDDYNRTETRRYHLSLSMGAAPFDPRNPASLDDLLVRADNLMYQDKKDKKHRR
jgi:diguanylate cyclase (GGDEF)-like protein/PAS domain S-box-containing protein